MTTEAYEQPPATDTYKQVVVTQPQPATIEHNGDCTLQVNDRDCTLEPSDRDCTLEVNRRVQDSNKEMVDQTHQTGVQTEADESGQGQQASRPRKRKNTFKITCGVITAIILIIVIIVPSIVATHHH